MSRLIIELREDVRFEQGNWHPADERARELCDALAVACRGPERLFSRPAAALDRERISAQAFDVPDLNHFYLVEGEAQALAEQALVAGVTDVDLPGAAEPTGELPPGAVVVACAPDASLARALDAAAASLDESDVLVVPHPLAARVTWAAAELAARRGVRVIAVAGSEPPPWATAVRAAASGKLASAVAAAARDPERHRRVRLRIDSICLISGGDLLSSEIYLEGWIDDGERRPFRIPEEGAHSGIRPGDPIEIGLVVYESAHPLAGEIVVHLELWEEDLGRDSLLNPDDLLGLHEIRFGSGDRWGEGPHEVMASSPEAECEIRYTIELL